MVQVDDVAKGVKAMVFENYCKLQDRGILAWLFTPGR